MATTLDCSFLTWHGNPGRPRRGRGQRLHLLHPIPQTRPFAEIQNVFDKDISHEILRVQSQVKVRIPNHIASEDGHTFAQPHLEMLLMRHVTGLLAEMFHWQCFNHCWIREQKEGVAVPLNQYMVDVVMGGEEIRDLHPWGGSRLLLAQPPDMVTAPQSLFFSRPVFFFFNRWLHRISRILAVLGYEGIKQATPVVLRPKRKSSAHSL